VIGQRIRWTITVKNNSTVVAADVNVVRVSEFLYRVKLISLTVSQGSCNALICNIGRLAPGATATITVVSVATQVGRVLNVVRVSSEEQESDYDNNTAAALVRVTAPKEAVVKGVKGAAISIACSTIGAVPRTLQAGTTSLVFATAHNRYGKPARRVLVQVRGLGLHQQARTNRQGVVRFTLTPRQAGIVHFEHNVRLTAGVHSRCRTLLAVLGRKTGKPPVTG
jgi:Domain of unknown function DUF11